MATSEGGWADRDQDNLLSLAREIILEGGWNTSWITIWRCGKETGILLHYYFPSLEGGWTGRGQGSFFVLRVGSYLWKWWNTDWRTAWRCGKKREYYYIIIFPERIWNFTSRKKRTSEHKGNETISIAFSSKSPGLLTSSIPINQLTYDKTSLSWTNLHQFIRQIYWYIVVWHW